MTNLFSFTGVQPNPDQTYQSGINQYLQQGQSQINPGQAQVAASNPVQAAGVANLAKAFQQSQQPALPAQMPVGSLQNPAATNQGATNSYNQLAAADAAVPYQNAMSSGIQNVQPPNWLQRMAAGLMNSGGNNGG